MINFKNFCKIFLASSLLLSCVEQKLQQVAVSSPQTNIGGGNVNGNQVNVGGNAGDIKTGDKSQINVGGNANVVVNKPAPVIDSIIFTGQDSIVLKATFITSHSQGKFNEYSITRSSRGSTSGTSWSYGDTPNVFRGFTDFRMEIKGKNFDAKNLNVFTNFDLPLLMTDGAFPAPSTKFKLNFDIVEKSDTRILVKFPTSIDFPKPTSEVVNSRINNYIPTPLTSAPPGGLTYDYAQKYRFRMPNYCFNEWGVESISTNELFVETDSGRVPIVINQDGNTFSKFSIFSEITEKNLNNYIYNCFLYPEIISIIQGGASYEVKSISYQKENNKDISIPLPTTSSSDPNYIPLKYTFAPTPISPQSIALPSTQLGMITAEIRPTMESNDIVLSELERLKLSKEIADSIVSESFPVQITATGTPAAIQKLQKLSAGNSNTETVLTFETLSTRSSRISSTQTQAISDEVAWQSLWQQHIGSDGDRPMINFEIETVLAVFLGQKPSGGFAVNITKVSKSGTELVVYYQETIPTSGNLVSQNLPSPSHIIKVRSSKFNGDFNSIRFEKSLK